ncbi:MAG: DUF2884 family protein [Arenimonas sp.]
MKHAVLAAVLVPAALLLASPPALARDSGRHQNIDRQCNVHTDWGVSTHRRAFVFTRKEPSPTEVGIGGGRLFIDGREQKLSAADHARLTRLEAEMQALLPQLREVVVQAVDIAFTALAEVARGLASDPQHTIVDLQSAQKRVHAEMDARPLNALNGDAIAGVITPIITEYVPQIVGGAISGALQAAFGGEQKSRDFEKRMQMMEQELHSKVEQRAKALEPLADAMCQRLQAMDRLDDELEFRLPDGDRLDLLQVGPRDKD